MCCALEIGMLVGGIILIIIGRIPLGNRVSQGVGPRIAGVVMLLPLPVAFGVGLVYGASVVAKGQQFDAQAAALKFAPIEAGIILFFLLASLGIIAATAKPVKRRRRRREDDYED